jgi:hypothetical protein
MRAWNDVRRVVLAQFRPQRASAGQGPGDLPLAFLPRLTPKRQHHSCGPVTTILLYGGGRRLAEEDAVPHKLVMTQQVRDWLHALRSGDPVTRRLVAEAIDHLLDVGPALGRPDHRGRR